MYYIDLCDVQLVCCRPQLYRCLRAFFGLGDGGQWLIQLWGMVHYLRLCLNRGYFTYYVLETGLLGTDNDVVTQLSLFGGRRGRTAPIGRRAGGSGGCMAKYESNASSRRTLSDHYGPIDPIVLAPHKHSPKFIDGCGDLQVLNCTTEWLAETPWGATPLRTHRRIRPALLHVSRRRWPARFEVVFRQSLGTHQRYKTVQLVDPLTAELDWLPTTTKYAPALSGV